MGNLSLRAPDFEVEPIQMKDPSAESESSKSCSGSEGTIEDRMVEPFSMPKLLNVSMDKLCYDLVLEVIDELEPEDVLELMKVSKRFQLILLEKPARIFGKQIEFIEIKLKQNDASVSIPNFPESTDQNTVQYFDLLSQVEQCSILLFWQDDDDDDDDNIDDDDDDDNIDDETLSALKKNFANLKVSQLCVMIKDANNFNNYLEKLKVEVTDRACLIFAGKEVVEENQELEQQFLSHFINRSLQNCKMISLAISEFDPTVYSALSETQHKLFVNWIFSSNVESAIEFVLNFGIPSENEEAACLVHWLVTVEINNRIKNMPEIHPINEGNKTFMMDTFMRTLRIHEVKARLSPDDPTHCYWKRIDENRDCIYVVGDRFFFAKYVSSIQ